MGKMRLSLCLLLTVICASATEEEGRAKKQPFVVDAVGNTLPPPSNVPATVGSPINLLTPDRYEFYTFDESGELVKRLMTLEEIQAIVAAGEEAEGLVTFANDNQPTIAYNFSQPPHTKVHNVVTNVQNVLKAQMEAHKNNPMIQPTFDTPDVSDSWSLILPSIFGNTGLDIIPDKAPSVVTLPETETINPSHSNFDVNEGSNSKEGNNEILSSSTIPDNLDDSKINPSTDSTILVEEISFSSPTTRISPTTTTTTPKPTTTTITTTTPKPTTTTTTTTTTPKSTTTTTTTTTTQKPTTTLSTTTTARPTTTKTTVKLTTKSPTKSTTVKYPVKVATTKVPVKLTTSKEPFQKLTTRPSLFNSTKQVSTLSVTTIKSKPQIVTTTTSRPKPLSTIKLYTTTTSVPTTTKPISKTTITTSYPLITKKPVITMTTQKVVELIENKIHMQSTTIDDHTTENYSPQYEKLSTFVPVSTIAYITERTTQKIRNEPTTTLTTTTIKPLRTTKIPVTTTKKIIQPSITTYKPMTSTYVLPTISSQDLEKLNSTTITTQSVSPSTTVSSTEFISIVDKETDNKIPLIHINNDDREPVLPLFDVAQSISQIASDLGGNYIPIPTVSNIIDSSKLSNTELESKENMEIEIPADHEIDTNKPNVSETKGDNFVKISTLDPHSEKGDKLFNEVVSKDNNSLLSFNTLPEVSSTISPESTTIDRIMSESMGDLLSQVVNLTPQAIVNTDKSAIDEKFISTTEQNIESTTNENVSTFVTTTYKIPQVDKIMILETKKSPNDIPDIDKEVNSNYDSKTTTVTENISEKVAVNEDINNKYVQISVSSSKNKTNANLSPETNSNVSLDNISIEENSYNNNTENNNKPLTTTSATENLSSKLVLATIKPNDFENVSPSITKVEDTKINKIPELLPKIDDFKKKIQKVNIDDKELANDRNSSWKLISTMSPPKANNTPKDKQKNDGINSSDNNINKDIVLEFSHENQGLEVTTKDLEEDIAKFTELCNELAFRYWNSLIENIDKRRSFVLSPFSITSMLAMMFMGAKGATSGEMNDILKLDDMVTFNPHFTLKNISDSIETSPESGVIVSAFIRELYSDRNKGKILTFYKERAQHFYNGHVEEINFKLVSDIIRRRTNMLVKRLTWGRINEHMKSNTVTMHPPLAAFSANIFQTDCTGSSVEGRDGEMYFVVSPNVRQRRLVPVPAVVYRSGFLAGYDPGLDATAAALGNTNSIISTLFVMPGQQGNVVHAEDLEALEQRLLGADPTTPSWNRLLRTLLPRIGLELQIPRFSHKSIFNVSSTLKRMGLKDLFDADHADLGGLNGPSKDLYLSDMIQSTTFVTCGEGVIGEQHHVEEYPESLETVARRRSSRWAADWDEPRDYQRAFHDPHDVGEAMHLPLHLRPRQARLPARNAQPARLKFDRPFLYFVRHNPSGMILYVGRYNPRLLP